MFPKKLRDLIGKPKEFEREFRKTYKNVFIVKHFESIFEPYNPFLNKSMVLDQRYCDMLCLFYDSMINGEISTIKQLSINQFYDEDEVIHSFTFDYDKSFIYMVTFGYDCTFYDDNNVIIEMDEDLEYYYERDNTILYEGKEVYIYKEEKYIYQKEKPIFRVEMKGKEIIKTKEKLKEYYLKGKSIYHGSDDKIRKIKYVDDRLIPFVKYINSKVRKLLSYYKSKEFSQWYFSPQQAGGKRSKQQIKQCLNKMK